jgi:hypothetical protein
MKDPFPAGPAWWRRPGIWWLTGLAVLLAAAVTAFVLGVTWFGPDPREHAISLAKATATVLQEHDSDAYDSVLCAQLLVEDQRKLPAVTGPVQVLAVDDEPKDRLGFVAATLSAPESKMRYVATIHQDEGGLWCVAALSPCSVDPQQARQSPEVCRGRDGL